MDYKTQTPEEITTLNTFADNWLEVLNQLKAYKEDLLWETTRLYQPIISFDPVWIRRKIVEDYGYPAVPIDLPLPLMWAMMLNAKRVHDLRATRIGIRLWLWVLTQGVVAVDDSNYYNPHGPVLVINLTHQYYNNPVVVDYINTWIPYYIGFSPSAMTTTINHFNGPYTAFEYMAPYFSNP